VTAQLLLPAPRPFEVEIAFAKLKIYNSLGSNNIPAELIQAGGETLECEIHKLNNSIWSNGELPEQWKKSIIVTVYKKGNKSDCSNY
jgi:hypothetical protein